MDKRIKETREALRNQGVEIGSQESVILQNTSIEIQGQRLTRSQSEEQQTPQQSEMMQIVLALTRKMDESEAIKNQIKENGEKLGAEIKIISDGLKESNQTIAEMLVRFENKFTRMMDDVDKVRDEVWKVKLDQETSEKETNDRITDLAINGYGLSLVTVGAVAVLLVIIMFSDTLLYIMKNSPPRVKAHSAFVIGVYPVVALATFCATIVPRSHLLAEAVTQGIFMAGMYQLFCLIVAYCGGEAELIRKVKPASLNTKVGPCCCWPCCCCLPMLDVNKNRVRYLRLLVLQLPVVQGLVYMTLLVMWAERESLYQINYMYVQPLIIVSILFGIWAMAMTINLLKEHLTGHWTLSKFFVLQLVLIFAKMQGLTMRIIVWIGVLPCHAPITPTVYGNLLYNCLMLLEMVLLGFIARRLYKKELPGFDGISDNPTVCVLSKHVTTLESIIANNNNSIRVEDKNQENKFAAYNNSFSDI